MAIRITPQFDEMTVAEVQQYLREHNSKNGILITAEHLGYCELMDNNKLS